MNTFVKFTAITYSVLSLIGCYNADSSTEDVCDMTILPTLGETIRFKPLKVETSWISGAPTEKGIKTYHSLDDFEQDYLIYTASYYDENIDFNSGQVLLVTFGENTFFEDEINVLSAEELTLETESGSEDYVLVSVTRTSPGTDCPTSDVISNSLAFIYIESNKKVLLKRTENSSSSCAQ